jgi:hypothetical protein
MPRTYSEDLMLSISKAPTDTPGAELARVCIDAKLPAKYIAEVFGVSRMTVHSWFRGSLIRANSVKRIKALLIQIHKDTESGRLPSKNLTDAKAYLRGFMNQ